MGTNKLEVDFICAEGHCFHYVFHKDSKNVKFQFGKYHLACDCHMLLFSWKEGEVQKAIDAFKKYHRIKS